jgi:hypothetical protein
MKHLLLFGWGAGAFGRHERWFLGFFWFFLKAGSGLQDREQEHGDRHRGLAGVSGNADCGFFGARL